MHFQFHQIIYHLTFHSNRATIQQPSGFELFNAYRTYAHSYDNIPSDQKHLGCLLPSTAYRQLPV